MPHEREKAKMRNVAQFIISALFLIAFMFFFTFLGLAAADLGMPILLGPAFVSLIMASLFSIALLRAI
jgi:hypothetical protein